MEQTVFDVTIIGGGPAGLYSAFYSGLREMRTKLIEYQPFLGGKVNVYPEKMIWDIGGLTPVTGEQLIQQLTQQGLTFQPEVVLGEKVTSISQNADRTFTLHTASGTPHYSKTIILAIGGGILKPTKLEIEGAERFEVTNLHYTVKSLGRFKGKTVLISGGGNTAIDWANELAPIAKKVYLTYRKEVLKGHEAEVSKLMKSHVACLLNTSIVKLTGAKGGEAIHSVWIQNHEDGSIVELEVDEVVVSHGYERDKALLDNSEIQMNMANEYGVAGTPLSETSVEGIFAAGDILAYEGKLHLIAGAFQDAANAVNRAKQYITPEAEAYGMVSSHNDLFIEKNRELKRQLFAAMAD
ncbi:NAD(P)/FAD-dependent oxidoreductase [Paenibacillus sp. MBLB2552]|uniref:Ferredoxin--NADP reductase n=1 Tax=Paenibacillus mellifer TaxID=2937794 RepID=A0A9X1XUI2_9BACL|nr:NAD(P)/FAD-dependent oxidoreductase [Paenibacillus mellifer]MCK8485594.1 NAD(P)/FAD-dependent oxidoreductase [Paenibacillus mellifer]